MSAEPSTPSIGRVSDHYQGEAGQEYVRQRQTRPREYGYFLNSQYFRPYIKAGDAVLDFGCGVGGMLPELQKMTDVVEGLEVNPAAAQVARERGFEVHLGLAQIPSGRKYDVVVSNHVLEHIRDVCGTLEALRDFVRPGGLFVTKLPIDDIRRSHQRGWSLNDTDNHLQTWTPRLFANVLTEAGFVPQELRIITSAWDPRLFWLKKLGLDKLAFWALAVFQARRQLFAVARAPA